MYPRFAEIWNCFWPYDPDEFEESVICTLLYASDSDATSFADAGTRDPVIGRLQAEAPGLRPPQIHSAYEAAVSASWLPGDPRPKPGACARPSRSTPEPSRTSQDAR